MGLCDCSNKKPLPPSQPITKEETDELYTYESALCKIRINTGKEIKLGTGFFCEINDNEIPFEKALFTNNHILNLFFDELLIYILYL